MVRIERAALILGVVLAGVGIALAPPRQPEGIRVQAQVDPNESPLRNRRDFVRRLNRVKVGMTATQVHDLLGKPDDVWTGDECDNTRTGFQMREAATAWAYGG